MPNSKKGYLSQLAAAIGSRAHQPNCAPAFVESTKCDVPTAMEAKRIPGPKDLKTSQVVRLVVFKDMSYDLCSVSTGIFNKPFMCFQTSANDPCQIQSFNGGHHGF